MSHFRNIDKFVTFSSHQSPGGSSISSVASLEDDGGEFEFADAHSSCLALRPAHARRTSFLYRSESQEEPSSFNSRKASVSFADSTAE
ncbi:hypothetical protein SprV_0602153200 [Sparganum proliferum]